MARLIDTQRHSHAVIGTIIMGAGGHATSLQALWNEGGNWEPLRESAVDLPLEECETHGILVGVGSRCALRRKIYEKYEPAVRYLISGGAAVWKISAGLQALRGAHIEMTAKYGVNLLAHVGVQVHHDCRIGDHCILSPGAILCGGVTLGDMCYISAGAVVLQGVSLPDEVYVPPGAVVYERGDFRVPVSVVRPDGTPSSTD